MRLRFTQQQGPINSGFSSKSAPVGVKLQTLESRRFQPAPDGQLGRTYFTALGDFPAQMTRLLFLVAVRSEEREVTQDAGESRFLFCWRRWVSKS